MAASADAPAATPPASPSERRSRYFSVLKVPAMLACLFAAVLGSYYTFYVIKERNYLIRRDFRLLATMGEQLEKAIETDQKIIANFLREHGKGGAIDTKVLAEAAKFIPILRSAEMRHASESRAASTPRAVQIVDREAQTSWVVRSDSVAADTEGFFTVPIGALVSPLLRGQIEDGTFDSVIVAARDGRVLFQSGDSAIRVNDVGKLIAAADAKANAHRSFDDFSQSSNLADAVVAGAEYTVFVQPCCGRMIEEGKAGAAGWVLAGLISQRKLTGESYAVSFSMMAFLSGIVLLAILSWPFVKLFLLGETQRIRVWDVALVGISGLIGVALITIYVLDAYAFWNLEASLDAALARFAQTVQTQVGEEVRAANDQLGRLDRVVANPARREGGLILNVAASDPSAAGTVRVDRSDITFYPFFDSLSLITSEGEQGRKMTFGSFVTPLVSVRDREYFRRWARSALYPPAFFEPIQSATTGTREAVLSKPAAADGFQVTALAIPMRTLLQPVIPPGFGFVVIDDGGRVLFHSDPQHTLTENFFLESDGSRRLRALITARHSEWLDLKYWADDHRAYVLPMKLLDQPLTIVTLYDKDLVRTVNVEWLALVMVLLVLYTSVYVVAVVLLLIVSPNYRAPWLWPDPARSSEYLDLLPSLAMLCLAFVIAIASFDSTDLLRTTWLLPTLAWIVVYVALRRTHAGRATMWPYVAGGCVLVPLLIVATRTEAPLWRGAFVGLLVGSAVQILAVRRRRIRGGASPLSPPANLSYGLVGVLVLMLIGVLPAAAAFRVSYGVQLENFVKHGQLRLALDQRVRTERTVSTRTAQVPAATLAALGAIAPRDIGAANWGVYDGFFFATRTEPGVSGCPARAARRDVLPKILEELLPFYSEAAVGLRELVHDETADHAWRWDRGGNELVFCSTTENLTLRSNIPGLFEPTSDLLAFAPQLTFLGVGWIAILVVVVWVVRVLIFKICVADVVRPIWSGDRNALREMCGPNLFLVAATPFAEQYAAATFCEIDLKQMPNEDVERDRWLEGQLTRIGQAAGDHNVLLDHFEERAGDDPFDRCKLFLLEQTIRRSNRTIVIVSAVPPSQIIGRTRTDDEAPSPAEVDMMRRWAEVLSQFTVVPLMPATPVASAGVSPLVLVDGTSAGWREIVWRLNALGFAFSAQFLDSERQDPHVDRAWKAVLPYAWHPDRPALDLGQLLTEVGERAESHYRDIWLTCTPAEHVLLGQLAEEGLLNWKTKKTVRRLMARGLVRRDPHFVLMNETFRQFVLSSQSRTEVAAVEDASTSTWDAVRIPFLVVLVASLAFFFVTQHELFNTTLGVVTGVAAAVPAVMKMASIFADRRPLA